LGFLRALLSRRDSYYLLSLLVPFVVYELSLKAATVLLLAGERGFASILELMLPDVFFGLGYALLWIGLFVATTRGGPLRWMVVFLLHAVTILVLIVTTSAYEHLRQTGGELDYGTVAEWVTEYDAFAPVLVQEAPHSATWGLLVVALLYAAFAPLMATRFVERRRGRSGSSSDGGTTPRRVTVASSLGFLLLALGSGSLSLLVSPGSTGPEALIAGESFVTPVLGGVQEEPAAEDAIGRVGTSVDSTSADSSASRYPAADARLALTSRTEKRNVVLIHLESARARSVTPYNENLNTMPFLNELAGQSLVAERAHVIVPRSSKGSTAINCGVEPALYAGPEYEPGVIPAPCLASLLKEQGYRTAWFQSLWDTGEDSLLAGNFGYEGFYPSQSTNTEGFQITNTFGYEDDIMLEPSERWLRANGDQPFLAQYFTGGAHYGYECLPNRYGYEHFSDDEEIDRYHNCLRMLDFFLQNLFEQYQRLGLYEDTIFVLYGDHGEGFEQERGRAMHGDTIWEEGLHVPLIVHDPKRFEGGEWVEGNSSQVDVLPTVLDLLGYEVEGGEYPGYSLLGTLPEDRTVMSSCITNRRCMASIKGDEKYVHHFGDLPDEFFDLSNDPLEQRNLADERGEAELDERREELFAWRSKVNAEHGRIMVNGNPVLGEE